MDRFPERRMVGGTAYRRFQSHLSVGNSMIFPLEHFAMYAIGRKLQEITVGYLQILRHRQWVTTAWWPG